MHSFILNGKSLDELRNIPDDYVQCCITRVPPPDSVEHLPLIFRELNRVVSEDGTLWIVVDDVYKQKNLAGHPWNVVDCAKMGGWTLRQDIIWHKDAPAIYGLNDRCIRAHEYVFLMAKSNRYYFDRSEIGEFVDGVRKGRSKKSITFKHDLQSVWNLKSLNDVLSTCVLAGCPEGGKIIDPFFGAGDVGCAALQNKRTFIGIDEDADLCRIAGQRVGENIPIEAEQMYQMEELSWTA